MARPKILLVDDNHHFLELEKEFLRENAVMIYTATNGREGLDLATLVRPDLLYLDLYLPDLDGAECCTILKGDPDLRSIPIVMVTSASNPEERARCLASGCDAILQKPFDKKTFLHFGNRMLPKMDVVEIRVPCRIPVVLQHQQSCAYGKAINLSSHGMFLVCNINAEIDDLLTLSFFVPGPKEGVVEATARIAWINNAKKHSLPEGFGLEFLNIPPNGIASIQAFMATIEEPERLVEDAYIASPSFF